MNFLTKKKKKYNHHLLESYNLFISIQTICYIHCFLFCYHLSLIDFTGKENLQGTRQKTRFFHSFTLSITLNFKRDMFGSKSNGKGLSILKVTKRLRMFWVSEDRGRFRSLGGQIMSLTNTYFCSFRLFDLCGDAFLRSLHNFVEDCAFDLWEVINLEWTL